MRVSSAGLRPCQSSPWLPDLSSTVSKIKYYQNNKLASSKKVLAPPDGVFSCLPATHHYTLRILGGIATLTVWKTLPHVPTLAVLMASFRPLSSSVISWSAFKSCLISSHSNCNPAFSKRWSSSLRRWPVLKVGFNPRARGGRDLWCCSSNIACSP